MLHGLVLVSHQILEEHIFSLVENIKTIGCTYMALFLSHQILDEQTFSSVEKIKTIGCTYMAAAGVMLETNDSIGKSHVTALAEFAFAIRKQMEYINASSWNRHVLR